MQVLLESLYVVNKRAKSYRGSSIDKRERRAQALYELKHDVLRTVHTDADICTRHIIDGEPYYYFKFRNWGFHAPVSEIEVSVETQRTQRLDEFVKRTAVTKSTRTEEDALTQLSQHGFNANTYLPIQQQRMSQWWFLPPA